MTDLNRSNSPFATLGQAARAALFLRLDPARIDATFAQWVMLIGVAISLQFVGDLLSVGAHGEFSLWGLPLLLFTVPASIVAAWALASAVRQPERTLMLTVALYALCIVVGEISSTLLWLIREAPGRLHFVPPEHYFALHAFLPPLWLGLAVALMAIRLLALSGRRIVYALLPVALLAWIPLFLAADYQNLWVPTYDPELTANEQDRYDQRLPEEAFYRQNRLLDDALTSLNRRPGGTIDLYFVGVAGYSSQDVFMKEVRYVANFFKARFATSGRTITLINNPTTVLDAPLASVTSLRRSLARIGKVMDPDKDILFLYLSSHGSRDHRLSLEFGSLRLESLSPQTLRKILDDSGIKRRIVVVSACYSGGFVEPLKEPNTLIITASAPDRQSHGCSNDAEFTFFGKAYFQDGLRHAASFVDAFDIAMPLVTEREIRDGYEPSQPMIYVGSEIARALDQFASERREHSKEKDYASSSVGARPEDPTPEHRPPSAINPPL